MAIKRVTYNTLSYLVAEIKDRYAEKSAIGALGGGLRMKTRQENLQ